MGADSLQGARPPGGRGLSGEPGATGGLTALTLPYQLAAALVLAVVAVVGAVHLGMVFLHVAPSNSASREYGEAVDGWIYPEFEQNWKLFAPNPLQQNVAVHARATVRTEGGHLRTTGWINLSAQDGAAIDGNLLPSHTEQNELRRAWDFYNGSHTSENVSNGLRGDLSERYLRRIALLRFDREPLGGTVERIQLRSSTTNVQPPKWSAEKIDSKPSFRELPWWTITSRDREVSAR
ncbi:DUF5819 family protein [Streptomyces mesophilus]|uniref:DUF5819 family protein n=1 Tax=Streptomyces mesophilus TaxID=1775132 RepID=UPI00331B6B9D